MLEQLREQRGREHQAESRKVHELRLGRITPPVPWVRVRVRVDPHGNQGTDDHDPEADEAQNSSEHLHEDLILQVAARQRHHNCSEEDDHEEAGDLQGNLRQHALCKHLRVCNEADVHQAHKRQLVHDLASIAQEELAQLRNLVVAVVSVVLRCKAQGSARLLQRAIALQGGHEQLLLAGAVHRALAPYPAACKDLPLLLPKRRRLAVDLCVLQALRALDGLDDPVHRHSAQDGHERDEKRA
mmetsp:Transcript_429/g.1592  ORF Transcript_429/g.1592 Transcript_429/m.1592 type:complete len:242 (+) Transcript_429:382-1107(+)